MRCSFQVRHAGAFSAISSVRSNWPVSRVDVEVRRQLIGEHTLGTTRSCRRKRRPSSARRNNYRRSARPCRGTCARVRMLAPPHIEEDHAGFGQFLAEGRADRDRIEHRVDGTSQARAVQRHELQGRAVSDRLRRAISAGFSAAKNLIAGSRSARSRAWPNAAASSSASGDTRPGATGSSIPVRSCAPKLRARRPSRPGGGSLSISVTNPAL